MKPLSYLEINPESLRNNVGAFRRLLGPASEIAAVVKANAYGHGLAEVVRSVEDLVDYFQVDDIEELRRLREVTAKPALLLGYVQPDDMAEAVSLGAELSIFTEAQLAGLQEAAARLGKHARVHIAVDSLLGREGILPSEVGKFARKLREHPDVEMVGAYSHFANIEDTSDFSHAQRQVDAFSAALRVLESEGYSNLKPHISATSGILAHELKSPNKNSIVRLGIGLYGLWPSEDLRERFGERITLSPALRWVSSVAQVKRLPAGHPIGYGLTYVTPAEMIVGLIPQGYSDGYARALSNKGEVLVRGTRCRVLGRVAMNMMVVDLSGIPEPKEGDEIILLGSQGDDAIAAEEMADWSGTINYEVVARISPLLPRISADS